MTGQIQFYDARVLPHRDPVLTTDLFKRKKRHISAGAGVPGFSIL
ncbi:hypothetical protein [Acidithiobacillus ferriphilus]|nr:hypothetical protein [Acidithiobacillus ferriphilus]